MYLVDFGTDFIIDKTFKLTTFFNSFSTHYLICSYFVTDKSFGENIKLKGTVLIVNSYKKNKGFQGLLECQLLPMFLHSLQLYIMLKYLYNVYKDSGMLFNLIWIIFFLQ